MYLGCPEYSVESLRVYANGEDLSVTEWLHSGEARREKVGFPGFNQGLDDEVIVEGWEEEWDTDHEEEKVGKYEVLVPRGPTGDGVMMEGER